MIKTKHRHLFDNEFISNGRTDTNCVRIYQPHTHAHTHANTRTHTHKIMDAMNTQPHLTDRHTRTTIG